MIANIVSDKELVVLIHNAYAYITRKKVRTGILFLILMVILISLYECLSILSYNAQLERSLYSASHSSIVVQKKDGSEFEHTSFENSVYEYEFVSKLKEAKVVTIKQGVTLDSLPKEYKNVVSVIGTNNTSKNVLFRSGVFTLTSGKNIDSKDRNSILIHSDLAKKNHLKIGDTIVLNSHTYTIKGIFEGKKHETYTGLSSDLSENTMFVDYNSLDTKMVTKLTIDSNRLKQVQSLYPSSEYVVSKDKNAYQSSLESIQSMNHMIQILSCSIIVCGLVVLSLVLVLWLRDRIHEIGILLSIGKSKVEIIIQFIFDIRFAALVAAIRTKSAAANTISSTPSDGEPATKACAAVKTTNHSAKHSLYSSSLFSYNQTINPWNHTITLKSKRIMRKKEVIRSTLTLSKKGKKKQIYRAKFASLSSNGKKITYTIIKKDQKKLCPSNRSKNGKYIVKSSLFSKRNILSYHERIPSNTIAGFIVNDIGKPLTKATVILKEKNKKITVRTDSHGYYKITADITTSKPHTISVSKSGYLSQSRKLKNKLSKGILCENFTLSKKRASCQANNHSIEFEIKNKQDQSLSNTTVYIVQKGTSTILFSGKTDSLGQLLFSNTDTFCNDEYSVIERSDRTVYVDRSAKKEEQTEMPEKSPSVRLFSASF